TSADAWNASLYDKLNFNIIRDFTPVATIARGPGVLVVHPSLPVKSVPELIAYAKSNPGKVTVASAGVGRAPHMYWDLGYLSVSRFKLCRRRRRFRAVGFPAPKGYREPGSGWEADEPPGVPSGSIALLCHALPCLAIPYGRGSVCHRRLVRQTHSRV